MGLPGEERFDRNLPPALAAMPCARPGEPDAGGGVAAGIAGLPTTDLHAALAGAGIQALYQPIVRFSDRHPVGLEVLARLDHPAHGTLEPALFIAPMEDAGLAWPLTEAVAARAFADWGGGRLAAMELTLALNMPLDVLLMPEALTRLEARRITAGIPARMLVIELTESRPLSRLPEVGEATRRLRALGYGLAIDDVGPAIRDHSALLDLPFTMMKLDKDVVQDAGAESAGRFLAAAIASARTAGLTVIAEGVEDDATWSRMAALGVDHAQGFLVARPLRASAVAAWHEDWCSRRVA